MKKLFQILAVVGIFEGVGFLSSFSTISAIPTWYTHLNKPFFNPPNYLFAPVWIVLYALMGVSLFLVLQKGFRNKKVKDAFKLFVIQLFLNGIWSPIFFGAKNTMLALFIIIAMLYFIYQTIRAFYKINKTASYLLWPYMAWVAFATILNFSIWFLNK